MKLKFWEKDKKAELTNVSGESVIEVDGKPVKVSELVEVHNSMAASAPIAIADDATVEIDGREVKVSDLKNSYRAKLKNEADEEKKKEEEERKNAEDEEAKKKADEERKNAEEEEKKKKEEMENSKKGEQHFNDLKKAAGLRGEPQEIKVSTNQERMVEGRKKYGTAA